MTTPSKSVRSRIASELRAAQGRIVIKQEHFHDWPDRQSPGCCWAIKDLDATEVFKRLFKSRECHRYSFWWDRYPITPQSQTARIIALELAALLVEEENPAVYPR